MARTIACISFALSIFAGLGCVHSPTYVEKREKSGVIALPDHSPEHREEAIKLIEAHVGENYKILEEGDAPRWTKFVESEWWPKYLQIRAPFSEYRIRYRKNGMHAWEWMEESPLSPVRIHGGIL